MVRRQAFLVAALVFLLVFTTGCPQEGKTATPTSAPTNVATGASPQPTAPPVVTRLTLQGSVTEVVKKVRPAVVSIIASSTVSSGFFLQPVPREGAGSGVIIDQQGHIVTNNHVVEGAEKLFVTLPDGRRFEARLVGRDPTTDVAVIQIQGTDLPTASFGDARTLEIGEWVIAIGNPFSLEGGPTVTVGVVGALDRSIQTEDAVLVDLIQTDAAINPGNSGGPLVNLRGEVVGINTAIDTRGSGIGFAISSSLVQSVAQELIAKGKVTWPYFGAIPITVNPTIARYLKLKVSRGVYLDSIERGTPAFKAGLRTGDVLVSFGGQPIQRQSELRLAIFSHKVGDQVELEYYRGGKLRTTTITLGKRPEF